MNLQTLLADDTVPELELRGLAEHTAEIAPGFAFVCVRSNEANEANDATLVQHCETAVARGAVAILYDPETPLAQNQITPVPVIAVQGLRADRGALAARFYADPSADQLCIGVTGTNGKTSVVFHLADISTRLGQPMGYSGTLGWGSLDELHDVNMTTGNAVALQRQLAFMRDAGMSRVALEVSSHALAQDRAGTVHFDYAIFTNLSRDHLDYHGTEAAYAAAKKKLFTQWPLQVAVINVDDEFGAALVADCPCPVVTYGKAGQWRWQTSSIVEDNEEAQGFAVTWQTPVGEYQVQLPMVADFAIANITAAMATLVAIGHSADEVFASLSGLRWVPGRMEVVGASDHGPTVVVDYAHTPDALVKVLAALRGFCRGQLICVVGCGGDRDTGKRPLMGAAAANGADLVWLTSDNPRSEPAADIIAAMRSGIDGDSDDGSIHTCVDRKRAIHQALVEADPADVVLVAGKGQEDYQEIEGQRLPFDDRLVVQQLLQELG